MGVVDLGMPYLGKNAVGIPVSNSEIGVFKDCKRKWFLQYYVGLRLKQITVTGPLPLGTRVHNSLEAYYKEGKDAIKTYTDLVAIDRALFEGSPDAMFPDKEDAFNKEAELGRLMIEGYIEWLDETGVDADMEVLQVEARAWTEILDGRVILQGKLDMKVRNRIDDSVSVWDHKALSVDEPVLTPRGWVPIGSLSVGDDVVAPDGSTANITGVYPQGIVHLNNVSFSDGTVIRACDDHLWWGRYSENRISTPNKVQNTSQIAEHLSRAKEKGRRKSFVIPLVSHKVYSGENHDVPIHPYALGVWLSEGTAGKAQFSTSDEFIVNKVQDVLGDVHRVVKQPWATYEYRIENSDNTRNSNFSRSLKELGIRSCKSWQKYIPEQYMTLPPDSRADLLQGIMDGDGFVRTGNGAIALNSTSKQLIDDISQLASSLGMHATIQEKSPAGKSHNRDGTITTCKPVYTLSLICPDSGYAPFSLPTKVEKYAKYRRGRHNSKYLRKIEDAGYGEAVCISVDSAEQTYVTRNYTITHNTAQTFTVYHQTAHMSEQLMLYVLLEKLNPETVAPVDGGVYNLLKKVKRSATAKPPFYERINVRFNDKTLNNFWVRVNGEIRDMIRLRDELDSGADHHYVAYPSPTRDCVWKCPFFAACPMFDDGSNIDGWLDNFTEVSNPYARYDNEDEGNTV